MGPAPMLGPRNMGLDPVLQHVLEKLPDGVRILRHESWFKDDYTDELTEEVRAAVETAQDPPRWLPHQYFTRQSLCRSLNSGSDLLISSLLTADGGCDVFRFGYYYAWRWLFSPLRRCPCEGCSSTASLSLNTFPWSCYRSGRTRRWSASSSGNTRWRPRPRVMRSRGSPAPSSSLA